MLLVNRAESVFRALSHARPLTSAEHWVLVWLAESVAPGLMDQVAQAAVVGECRCGCSSVQLLTSAPPLPLPLRRALSATGRSDHLCVGSTGKTAAVTASS